MTLDTQEYPDSPSLINVSLTTCLRLPLEPLAEQLLTLHPVFLLSFSLQLMGKNAIIAAVIGSSEMLRPHLAFYT